jgi:hypothetical protein
MKYFIIVFAATVVAETAKFGFQVLRESLKKLNNRSKNKDDNQV